ncbi:actin family [Favolaschia claudopus]|uniref:Actin family n=1 Tax=Favolaschia claudopus TaxID=2862362 RepID=A0AAW0AAD4_9AGAR
MYMNDDAVALVFDNGSAYSRAGWEELPTCVFPSIVGRPRNPEVISAFAGKTCFVGEEAYAKRGIMGLKHPIEGAHIFWLNMEAIWNHTFYDELEPPLNSQTNLQEMTSIMFEKFNVPAFYVQMGAVLGLHASGRTTGLIMDSGEVTTWFVPIHEGLPSLDGIRHLDIAGRQMTDKLVHDFLERGYPLITTGDREIVRDIKETMCYVSLNSEQELHGTELEQNYELPDGEIITVGKERFSVTEEMFSAANGIPSSMLTQPSLYQNIVLSSGNTMFPGLSARMQKELSKLAPLGVEIQIDAPARRKHSAWIGGSILASLSTFRNTWCSKQDYAEYGPDIVNRKCRHDRTAVGTPAND